ncbi:hypothetical protein BC829DRAFT_423567 [Chytridium lagenaria]|nr:hypothetical protein BC829DRAFT_423567 [Chytridium lagenaria]
MSSTTRKRRRSSGAADEEDVEDMQLTRMDNVFPPHAAIRSSHNKFLVNDCLSFLQASVQQHNINIVACLAVVSRLWSGEDDDWSIIQIKLVEGLMPQQRNSKHILNAFSKVSAPERSVSDNVDDFGYWPRLLVASRSFSENVCNVIEHWKKTFPGRKKLSVTAINEQWKIVAPPTMQELPPRRLKRSKEDRKNSISLPGSFYLTLADLLMEAVIRAFLAEEDAGEIIEIDEDDAANDRETSIAIKLANVIFADSTLFPRMVFMLLQEKNNDVEKDSQIILGVFQKCIASTYKEVPNVPTPDLTKIDDYAITVLFQSWVKCTQKRTPIKIELDRRDNRLHLSRTQVDVETSRTPLIQVPKCPAKFLSRSDVMLCRGVPPCCSPTPYTLKMAPTSMTAIYDVFPIASLPSSSPLVLLTHPSKQCACVPPRLAIQQNSEDDDNASDENNDNASDQQTSDHAESTRDSRPSRSPDDDNRESHTPEDTNNPDDTSQVTNPPELTNPPTSSGTPIESALLFLSLSSC